MGGPMTPGRDEADTIVVIAGGVVAPHADLRARLPERPAFVIAADSGVSHAEALGLPVDVVVGDLDSVDEAALARARALGAAVEHHPAEKDQTDLELALDVACRRADSGGSVLVIASMGGRLDHGLANVFALASAAYASLLIEAYVDDWHITVVRNAARLHVRRGAIVTLLPVGGDATGVGTRGLRYPLRRETLAAGTSRGVSNVAEFDEVEIDLSSGVLLALWQWAD